VLQSPTEPSPDASPDAAASRRPPAARQPDDEAQGHAPEPDADLSGTEGTDPAPAQVEPTQVEVEAEPVQPEPVQPEPVQPEPVQPEPAHVEAAQVEAEPVQLEAAAPRVEPEPGQVEAKQVDADPVDVEAVHAEPAPAEASDAPAAPTASPQRLPGDPDPEPLPARTVARGRLGNAMRPRATRGQLLAGLLCAVLGFALVVQARQTQTQGLDSLRQADLVRLLDNVTNAEARAEQDVRDQQAIRDRLLSGSGTSAAAQEAAQ
jgi:hypothetical protein